MIAYASRTGNVRYIVSKLNGESIEISHDLIIGKPYLLITYTDGIGEVPTKVQGFLHRNAQYCRGVVVSGNINFGHVQFGAAGEKIAFTYRIPLVRKLDLRGVSTDYEAIQKFYDTRVIE